MLLLFIGTNSKDVPPSQICLVLILKLFSDSHLNRALFYLLAKAVKSSSILTSCIENEVQFNSNNRGM